MLGELNNRGFLTIWGRFQGVGEVPVHSWGAGGDDKCNQTVQIAHPPRDFHLTFLF